VASNHSITHEVQNGGYTAVMGGTERKSARRGF